MSSTAPSVAFVSVPPPEGEPFQDVPFSDFSGPQEASWSPRHILELPNTNAEGKPTPGKGWKEGKGVWRVVFDPNEADFVISDDAVVGIPTGERNGVWCLDLDEKHGKSGSASLDAYMQERGLELPRTYTRKTKSGGKHLLFTMPPAEDGRKIGDRQGVLGPASGIDVRGEGGWLYDGPKYAVEVDVPPAAAPEWLLELCKSKESAPVIPVTPVASTGADFERRRALACDYLASAEPCISGVNGQKQIWAVALHLSRALELPVETSMAIIESYNARCIPPWEPHEWRRVFERAQQHGTTIPGAGALTFMSEPAATPTAPGAAGALLARLHDAKFDDAPTMPEPVTIELSDRHMNQSVDAACAAIARHPDVYTRGGELVRLVRISRDEATEARTETESPLIEGTPTIRAMKAASLLPMLSSVASFARKSAPKIENGELVAHLRYVKPDKDLVAAVHDRGQWPGMRSLKGIIETPLMRPDGSILQDPGHDPTTGYLYAPDATRFPLIADKPTRDDARRALAELAEVFCDFPYVDEPSRAATLAALLSVIARPAIKGNVPAFVLEAAMPGSGKGLQAHVIALIATGRAISLYEFPESEEEAGKRVSAIARRALPLFSFDNVKKGLPFGGAQIEAALTCNGKVSIRILGHSEAPDIAWESVMLVTGNNVTLRRDTVRRTLRSRLHPPTTGATYKHPDLADWVLAERPRLVAAALTLLRAYVVAGRPDPVKRVPSFEAWSDLIPSAIIWAGGADATLAVPEAEDDEEGTRIGDVIAAWPDGKVFTCAQLFGIMKGQHGGEGGFFAAPVFAAALTAFADDTFATVNTLGRKLRGERDNVHAGKALVFRATGKLWTVAPR